MRLRQLSIQSFSTTLNCKFLRRNQYKDKGNPDVVKGWERSDP
jgi:hypothetical protein